jgi:hypothetical protein
MTVEKDREMATRKTTTGGASAPAKDTGPEAKAASPARKSAATKVPAAEKARPTAKPAPAASASAKAPAAGKAAKGAAVVTPEQRANYIEVAAFYIAERRGFVPGDPMADWLEAQAEIDRAIANGQLGQR